MSPTTEVSRHRVVFHADLSAAPASGEYDLHGAGRRQKLIPHTDETRAAARAAAPELEAVPDQKMTHQAAILLPADKVTRVHIKGTNDSLSAAEAAAEAAEYDVFWVALYIPGLPSGDNPTTTDTKYSGVAATSNSSASASETEDSLPSPPPAQGSPNQTINQESTAFAILFHHPGAISYLANPKVDVMSDLAHSEPPPGSLDVARIVYQQVYKNMNIQNAFQDYLTAFEDLDLAQDGPPNPHADPQPWAWLNPAVNGGETGYPSIKNHKICQPNIDVLRPHISAVMTQLLLATQSDPNLYGMKWWSHQGQSVQAVEPPAPAPDRDLAAIEPDDAPGSWTAALTVNQRVHGIETTTDVTDATTKTITIDMTNKGERWQGCFLRFLDSNGCPISSAGATITTGDNTAALRTLGDAITNDDWTLIGYMEPVPFIMGVPQLEAPGEMETATVTFPSGAASAQVAAASLGNGSFEKINLVGIVATAVMGLGVPAYMLASDTAQPATELANAKFKNLLDDDDFLKALVNVGTTFLGLDGDKPGTIDWDDLADVAKLLFNTAAAELLSFLAGEITTEEIAEEVPFVGWAIRALDAVADVAQISQTIADIAESPPTVLNTIQETVTSTVEVYPDPRSHAFPTNQNGSPGTLVVKMMRKNPPTACGKGKTSVTVTHPSGAARKVVPPYPGDGNTWNAVFPNNTLGGYVKFDAALQIDNGWPAAQGTTGWIENTGSTQNVSLYLVEKPIPLNKSTTFEQAQLLTYTSPDYSWTQSQSVPQATANSIGPGQPLVELHGLTLSQRYAALGYAWQATGGQLTDCHAAPHSGYDPAPNVFQSVDIPGIAASFEARFPSCAMSGTTQLIFDPFPQTFKMQKNPNPPPPEEWDPPQGPPQVDTSNPSLGDYYVDVVTPASGGGSGEPAVPGAYHLRPVDLSTSGSGFDSPDSYAIFPWPIDAFAMHPSGHVVAISTLGQMNCLMVAKLEKNELPPKQQVPTAQIYAGQALHTDRQGLLLAPVALTCSYDGTVFVLESNPAIEVLSQGPDGGYWCTKPIAYSRLQAFDHFGNPVDRFVDGNNNPTPFFELPSDHNYLDIAAVGDDHNTFLFVLYFTGNGKASSDYFVDIYQFGAPPKVSPLPPKETSSGYTPPPALPPYKAPDHPPLIHVATVPAARITVDMWHSMYTLYFAEVSGTTLPTPSLSKWNPSAP